jgi:hypothetical protein
MTELRINLNTLLNSSLTTDQFIILLLLYKKEYKAVEKLVIRAFGYTDEYYGEIYHLLEEDGWIKINGAKLPQDIEVRGKFIELLSEREAGKSESWIDEYRDLFRNTRSGKMGDKVACIRNMDRLLSAYPQYGKEDILRATRHYIRTCNDYNYLTQADYFISKTDLKTGDVVCKIITYLEEVSHASFSEPEDFSKTVD